MLRVLLQSLHGKKYTANPCEIPKDHKQVTQITDSLISRDGIVNKTTGKIMKYVISLFTDFPFIYLFSERERNKFPKIND